MRLSHTRRFRMSDSPEMRYTARRAMTTATAAAIRRTPPHIHRERSLADTLQLILLKSPKHAEALKTLAEMVLEDLIKAEFGSH